jgi:hypothetical protein
LYYAGHGYEINNQNLLIPIDFNDRDDPKTANHRAYAINELLELLCGNEDKTKIIILDACRKELGIRGKGHDFAPMIAPQGSIIAFSTSPGQSSIEGHGHGLYTEALLRYMDLPRKSIETVFKHVRTELASMTHGIQIPWEHTSLIGEFYLNSDTIYDGFSYSNDAYADGNFAFRRGSKVEDIVIGLKSYVYNTQQSAMAKMKSLDYYEVSAQELFVLGRNIYQAACGNCYACQSFIEGLANNSSIPGEAKVHLLNGMVYEIYYDSHGKLRHEFKKELSIETLKIVEKEDFYGCSQFIASKLVKEDPNNVFYIPGQDEKVDVIVDLLNGTEGMIVADIIINGNSHYYDKYTYKKVEPEFCLEGCQKRLFEFELHHRLAVPNGYLNVFYKGKIGDVGEFDKLYIPLGGYLLFPRKR